MTDAVGRFKCSGAALVALCLLLGACGKQGGADDAGDSAKPASAVAVAEGKGAEGKGAEGKGAERGVTLTQEQSAALGVAVATLAQVSHQREIEGFGTVLGHDLIAQAVADTATTRAAARQSAAALARIGRLANTAGADSAEARELAERQAATDAAAMALALRKASALLGEHPPWATQGGGALLEKLASGNAKLVRVSFPLGATPGGTPPGLRLSRLDGPTAAAAWTAQTVWEAPADPNVPGRSWFAALEDHLPAEGERLLAFAAGGGAETGVLVPAAAAVMSDGRYWCYTEDKPGTYVREPIDIGQPSGDGYFVKEGLKPGDRVVVAAAGLLLARELNPGTEAE